MARKVEFKGFVDCIANDRMRKAVEKDKRTLEQLVMALIALADGGYKWAIRWSEFHTAYQVSLYGMTRGMVNEGWQLTAQHVDPEKAIRLLLVVHETGDGEWNKEMTHDVNW